MNALELLKKDHDQVKELLEELDSTSENEVEKRRELFERVKTEMGAHEDMEEEIFYPALKEHPKAKEIVLEGYEEHHLVDHIMGQLGEVSFEDETWAARFTVMKENIEHHIEEEEDEMFDKAKSVFDENELDELGSRMQQRKKEILSS